VHKPDDDERHTVTLAVWDQPSPLIAGAPSTLKIGVKCSHACDLAGAEIELRGSTGLAVARATLTGTPWPGTSALYWTEMSFTAPAVDGPHTWMLVVQAAATEAAHDEVSAPLSFIVARRPEHRITVKAASDAGSGIEGVAIRAGVFKAATDPAGFAALDVPSGTYDLQAWKQGYELASTTVAVAGNVRIDLALVPVPVVEEEYWR
jgi:hypothetical protein